MAAKKQTTLAAIFKPPSAVSSGHDKESGAKRKKQKVDYESTRERGLVLSWQSTGGGTPTKNWRTELLKCLCILFL